MTDEHQVLEIYRTGSMTVVGFGGQEILDQIDISGCRGELVALVKEHEVKSIAFDLAGVKLIPSGLLGLLASLRQLNVNVHLCNPSEDVSEVLQVTRLDQIFQVYDIDFNKDATP